MAHLMVWDALRSFYRGLQGLRLPRNLCQDLGIVCGGVLGILRSLCLGYI